MTRVWREKLFDIGIVRWLVTFALLCRGGLLLLLGKQYRGMHDFCWIVRVSNVGPAQRIARGVIFRLIESTRRSGRNSLIDSYRADPASTACASLYTVSGLGPHELFRDLIVLKPASAGEKGVILLKYARTFSAVMALLDIARLMERYVFVLEPCWTGYCDPSVLMFFRPGNPVIVQCFTEDDYQFIASVGAPLVPMRLGPADWVNADIFKPAQDVTKQYDLVMVANWARHKRHVQLFRALSEIRDRAVNLLLVGFPWGGRTTADIRREIASMQNDQVKVEIREKVPHAQLAELVGRSKAFVFLSRKEGDNKAVVEAMFAGVPAIVYAKTIGGARSRINPATGVLATDAELADKIRHMLDHHHEYTPRQWALENTGSSVATRILDQAIKREVTALGGAYTRGIVEKMNAPNLAYKDEACRSAFKHDYEFVLSCLRITPAKVNSPSAVPAAHHR